jgi:translation initiation factor 2B subunit (eIF-2B alpha/beta/delta family)
VQVVVAEAAPRFDGHTMARQLADAKVQTTLIADSAVFAMMARANKVRHGWTADTVFMFIAFPYLSILWWEAAA